MLSAGCAEIEVPRAEKLITDPIGDATLKRGMTKTQVINIYGDPSLKQKVVSKEWNQPREEWFYRAGYNILPVNAGHLSEDLYLYFDGENLTTITRKSLGSPAKESAVAGQQNAK